jgi:hypothetical protein
MWIKRVKGDGSCMYRAVAQARSAVDDGRLLSAADEKRLAWDLRVDVAQYIATHPRVVNGTEARLIENPKTPLAHFVQARVNSIMNGEWGEDLELHVLSHLLHRAFHVYDKTGARMLHPVGSIVQENRLYLPPLSLAYDAGTHYDAMIPSSVPKTAAKTVASTKTAAKTVRRENSPSDVLSPAAGEAYARKQYRDVYIQSLRRLRAAPSVVDRAIAIKNLNKLISVHRAMRPQLLARARQSALEGLNDSATASALDVAHLNVATSLGQTLDQTRKRWRATYGG